MQLAQRQTSPAKKSAYLCQWNECHCLFYNEDNLKVHIVSTHCRLKEYTDGYKQFETLTVRHTCAYKWWCNGTSLVEGLLHRQTGGEDSAWQGAQRTSKEIYRGDCVAKQGSPRKASKRACQSENQKHLQHLQYKHHQYNHQSSSKNFLPFIEEDTMVMDNRHGLQVENQYFIGDIKRLV